MPNFVKKVEGTVENPKTVFEKEYTTVQKYKITMEEVEAQIAFHTAKLAEYTALKSELEKL